MSSTRQGKLFLLVHIQSTLCVLHVPSTAAMKLWPESPDNPMKASPPFHEPLLWTQLLALWYCTHHCPQLCIDSDTPGKWNCIYPFHKPVYASIADGCPEGFTHAHNTTLYYCLQAWGKNHHQHISYICCMLTFSGTGNLEFQWEPPHHSFATCNIASSYIDASTGLTEDIPTVSHSPKGE